MANPNVRLALRVHDECNGELSFPGRFFLNQVLRLFVGYNAPRLKAGF